MILKKKLALTLFAVFAVPYVMICGAAYYLLSNQITLEAQESQAATLDQVHAVTLKELQQARFVSEHLAKHVLLLRYVNHATAAENFDMKLNAQRLLEAYHGINNAFDEIQLLDESGRTRLGVSSGGELSTLAVGQQLLKSARSESRVQMETVAGVPRVIALSPINGDNGVAGYLLIVMTRETLDGIMALGQNPFERFYLSEKRSLVIDEGRSPGDPFLLPVAIVEGVNGSMGRAFFENAPVDGVPSRIGARPLLDDIWLVSVNDDRITQNESDSFLYYMVPAIGTVLLLVAALIYLQVVRALITPLLGLINATAQIGAGNFSPNLDIKSRDEVGVLARSFLAMGQRLRVSNQKITQLAYFDSLTKLPNRNALKQTLENLIMQADRSRTMLAVLFIDLDDFKKVNDRLGHAAGDELLVVISDRLLKNLRRGDLVSEGFANKKLKDLLSRRGGDEFNAILTNVAHPREVGLIAERIISDINKPVKLKAGQVEVGASIGVALYPDDGSDAESLLHNADMAMYDAKSKGKNNFQIYTAETNAQVHKRLDMELAITDALKNNYFSMSYQPKVDLITMEVMGFEALIRWEDPERGPVGPGEFIPIAEESQLIFDIGNWVLAEVLHQLNQWESSLPAGVRVAINISVKQLRQLNFAEHLISMAEHFDVPLSRLEVEITETSVMADEALVVQHLHALRLRGVKISLDDFGTGYSSLTFLSRLPIDVVKIDSSFIFDVMESPDHQAIVSSVLELCQKLSLNTIAEGIETPAQLAFLMSNGCTEGQGYLFAKPMPVDQVLSFLEDPTYLAL